MRRLEGKSIVVAGAGGIGGGCARRYAAEGARVVLGDLDRDGAQAIVDEIAAAGGEAIAVRLDGADKGSVAAAVATACARYGGLDGIHANFATFIDDGSYDGVAEMPLAAFDETMRVNLRGFVLCAQSAIPALLAGGGGGVVFTSSIAAYRAEGKQVAYAIAKQAAHALMRHIAVRYGPQGIRANSIAPGTILHGDMAERLPQDFKDHLMAIARIKSRFGRPEDIAALGALLMSDEGSYITGQIITVDGGATMRP
jgi:NAD(P)-dependent dehydrogenase (short-subunit alcohol dehydrogenase family)